jgi:DNA-binding cell septation regulator SpoVG
LIDIRTARAWPCGPRPRVGPLPSLDSRRPILGLVITGESCLALPGPLALPALGALAPAALTRALTDVHVLSHRSRLPLGRASSMRRFRLAIDGSRICLSRCCPSLSPGGNALAPRGFTLERSQGAACSRCRTLRKVLAPPSGMPVVPPKFLTPFRCVLVTACRHRVSPAGSVALRPPGESEGRISIPRKEKPMRSNPSTNSAKLNPANNSDQGTPKAQAQPNLEEMLQIVITQISVTLCKGADRSSLRAFVKIVLNGQFVVSGLRIVEGKTGFFVAFPRDYDSKAQQGWDICHPITGSLRSYMTQVILDQFQLVRNT